jgi:hypothetical protein
MSESIQVRGAVEPTEWVATGKFHLEERLDLDSGGRPFAEHLDGRRIGRDRLACPPGEDRAVGDPVELSAKRPQRIPPVRRLDGHHQHIGVVDPEIVRGPRWPVGPNVLSDEIVEFGGVDRFYAFESTRLGTDNDVAASAVQRRGIVDSPIAHPENRPRDLKASRLGREIKAALPFDRMALIVIGCAQHGSNQRLETPVPA